MGEFRTSCHLCGEPVVKWREGDGGPWGTRGQDGSEHAHETVWVTTIVSDMHYRDDEDKSAKIGDMTIGELEGRIRGIASQVAAMRMGSYLHAEKGFARKGFKEDFVKRRLEVDGRECYVTGMLDGRDDDCIVEAKFVASKKDVDRSRRYAEDQCDIYGWITGLPKSRLHLHVINEGRSEEEIHVNNPERGESLATEYVRRARAAA